MEQESSRLEVVFEDNHLLVLNKPALLATMGAAPGVPTLLEQAREYVRIKYKKPGNVFLGVVSRLDAHVSGLIMFARTSKCASRISSQLRSGSVKKIYRALVPEGVLPKFGTLENWVVKHDASRRVRCVVDENVTFAGEHGSVERPKKARLRYQVIATDCRQGIDLIEVELETGRKHQIRVQLAYAGAPIIGDVKYGSVETFTRGIGLHCFQLALIHPTLKTSLEFEVAVPKSWRTVKLNV